jgi:hypothetical protein
MRVLHSHSRDYNDLLELYTEYLYDSNVSDECMALMDTSNRVCIQLFGEDSLEYEYELRRQVRARVRATLAYHRFDYAIALMTWTRARGYAKL